MFLSDKSTILEYELEGETEERKPADVSIEQFVVQARNNSASFGLHNLCCDANIAMFAPFGIEKCFAYARAAPARPFPTSTGLRASALLLLSASCAASLLRWARWPLPPPLTPTGPPVYLRLESRKSRPCHQTSLGSFGANQDLGCYAPIRLSPCSKGAAALKSEDEPPAFLAGDHR